MFYKLLIYIFVMLLINKKNIMLKEVENVRLELDNFRNKVIGLFKQGNSFELVIAKNENDTIDSARLTQFGIIQSSFNVPLKYGKLEMFPNNKNMNQLLDNPFEWIEFINKFDK